MGAVVVTADAHEPTTTSTASDTSKLARAAAARASTAYLAQLRTQAVAAAQTVVDEASRVRSDAAQAAVPEEVLAELDAATAALQVAMEDVTASDLPVRSRNVSRDAERAEDAERSQDAEPEAEAQVDTESAAVAAAPVDPAAPGVEVEPEVAPGDRLAEVTLPDVADPATTPLREALDRVKQAADVVLTTTEQKKAEAAAAQAAAEEAARVAAEQEAQRAAWKASLQGYANGQIPSSALCGVSFDSAALLRCDAAQALEALDAAFFAQFGTHLDVSDSYRSYGAQVACRANKGRLCAAPGTSNHGMGVAVDLGGNVQSFGTAQHEWMRQHAPAYQWTLPEWARQGGSKPEPWHWEYVG
ncbi:M15 family metallopeptidase [Cellulomonas wangsupingiae]|uniref:M15 family metallopeptidase n=1 Tax=Cellulomonas wangsupingiae TaxID=2968085 RepID=A0ABY5K5K3_9CELL|nr:M15 family metallopeptidase [Cellulomonas wangsupingiae]MCC2336284.1 M15 family metallopeptidase [Cellulomonas wangsupingiae]MCM0640714.1 M15 family metallopeptidase [Cellulomonas wangsupingiae]UUI65734.1 M15 family metallopeptidase [Cellulomonas wangsupingiae]